MLATVMWETNHLVTEPAVPPARRAHRAPRWGTPVEESGRGRINAHDIKDYYLPAKVQRNPTGGATVTEQDGDTFQVGEDGRIVRRSSNAGGREHRRRSRPGVRPGGGRERSLLRPGLLPSHLVK